MRSFFSTVWVSELVPLHLRQFGGFAALEAFMRKTIVPMVLLLLGGVIVVLFVIKQRTPIALLDNNVIREADFQQYLQSVYSREKLKELKRLPSARQDAFNAYLDSLAIIERARREGVDRDTRYKKAVELMETKALAHAMIERNRDDILRYSRVAPEEAKAYYDQHKNEYSDEPYFTIRHILVYVKGNPAFPEQGRSQREAWTRITKALMLLRSGKEWDTVARAYSDDLATNQNGGLLRERTFGFFAPEVESAIRVQALGRPGEVIRSSFGYHIIQVEERKLERTAKPFEAVRDHLLDRLTQERASEVRRRFMSSIQKEVGYQLTDAGKEDFPLTNEESTESERILAVVSEKTIRESDFRWFLKDALSPEQRGFAVSSRGSRSRLLASYLDMLVLEAKARKEGLDRTSEYLRERTLMKEALLFEFVQQRDKTSPLHQLAQTNDELTALQRRYVERLRAEAHLRVIK